MPALSHPWTALPLFLTGVGGSGLFYLTVYYSNGDPDRPGHSIGMSEFCVGLGGMLGPACMGLLVGKDPASLRPYVFGAALAFVAAALVPVLWRLGRKSN